MYGIDAQAHKAAVDAGGKTIAVMPCGIERIHPAYQEDLYNTIQETGGLIISEWDGDSMPAKWTFPKRNRIVAGLAQATLVVEAGLESGSLITAAFAKKFGRRVFAVPGPITSEVSKGTAKLVQEGASLVMGADDILAYFGKKQRMQKNTVRQKSDDPVEQSILDTLGSDVIEIDWIARKIGMPVAKVGTALSLMELRGVVSEENGKYYVN
jgi:DNA processing protein